MKCFILCDFLQRYEIKSRYKQNGLTMSFNFGVKTIRIVAKTRLFQVLKQYLYQFVCFYLKNVAGQDEILRT